MGGLNIDWTALDNAAQDSNDASGVGTGPGLYRGEPYAPDTSGSPDAFVGGQPVDWVNGDPGQRGSNGYQPGTESDLRGVNPSSSDPLMADARAKAASIFDQTNLGQGAGNSAVANTATIAGDYQTGQTYGNPTPTGGPHGAAPSLPMGSAPPSQTTSGYNQPLLGGTPVTGPQLPGAAVAGGDLSAAQRVQRDAAGNVIGVASANGYFDPRYQGTSDANGHQSLMTEYLRGDRLPGTVDALRILAEGNFGDLSASAKAVLGAEARTSSNVMGSQLEQNFAQRHNAEIQQRLGAGDFAGNQAAQSNLTKQMVQENQSPLSNSEAFPMAQKMVDDLNQIRGVRDVKFDGVNVVFQDASHATPQNPTGVAHIPMNEWADWYPVIADRLQKQDAPAPAAAADNTGGGGYGGGRPPRGNGGSSGSVPPAAPPPAKSGIPTPETGPDLTQTKTNKTRYQQTPM
jgi:hypothetical protein